MAGKLIIVRHQESQWNKLGKWTGSRDVHLTEHGFQESENIGLLIQDLTIDYAFASMSVRAIETLSCILNVCKKYNVTTEHSPALNERDYGDYTGKNKFDMEKILGEEEYKKLRRSWNYPIPNGESLKMVYDRVLPFFINKILPMVLKDKNVLVVAHGNSLRALTKYIENISDEGIAEVEIPFDAIIIYDLDKEGHMLNKETKERKPAPVSTFSSQVIATIGPSSSNREILNDMIQSGLNVARLNFSWGTLEEKKENITLIRQLSKESNIYIPIISDIPGPRIQDLSGHKLDINNAKSAITEIDKSLIKFSIEQKVDYVAVSFVGSPNDIKNCKEIIKNFSGKQKVIAKIERKIALDSLEDIVKLSDAVMIARGDLGNEIPIEEIPFIQEQIVKVCKSLNKPVIVATQMMLSMKENPEPTRAEVTDVESAVKEGADAVMLSEETATGKYPVDAVKVMKKIIIETKKHLDPNMRFNHL